LTEAQSKLDDIAARSLQRDLAVPRLSNQLAAAERNVEESERRVARQQEIITMLATRGHDTGLAEAILSTFAEILQTHRRHLLDLQAEAQRQSWQPVATAPFDRLLELAVIDRDGVHTVAFACRRILGGWLKAESRERIEVAPTHWRSWSRQSAPGSGTLL
jgi:hypothetical protein